MAEDEQPKVEPEDEMELSDEPDEDTTDSEKESE